MDEADLLFSYGYEENIRTFLPHLPSIYQAILLSATLSDVGTSQKVPTHTAIHLLTYHHFCGQDFG